jgi:nascent polypeptide-associated complex subunit alpha
MGRRLKPRAVRRSKQKASGELVSNKSSRAMKRQMRSMGMDMEELEGVQEVRIKKEDGEIVLNQPQVSLIKQQGMEIYQVIANPEAGSETGEGEPSAQSEPSPVPEAKEIPEEDVTLVASQANVSLDEARKALEANEGDLARAILSLKT